MSAERTRLIKELDRVHSLVVRKSARDNPGHVKCYTCDYRGHWVLMTCGHCWSRKAKSIRWDWDNTRVQCYYCQGQNSGERNIFEKNLRAEIGDERVDALEARKRVIRQWTVDELREMIEERNEILRNL